MLIKLIFSSDIPMPWRCFSHGRLPHLTAFTVNKHSDKLIGIFIIIYRSLTRGFEDLRICLALQGQQRITAFVQHLRWHRGQVKHIL